MVGESHPQPIRQAQGSASLEAATLPSSIHKYYCYVVVVLFASFLVGAGCEPSSRPAQVPAEPNDDLNLSSFYTHFAPTKIDILPLTELDTTGGAQRTRLNLYVSLLDAFGSQIKSPGVFRIELYDYVQRSAEPKGRRTAIWPDIDLTDPAANNNYWNDFLRAYRFDLPIERAGSQDYILQVTCLCPSGSRLSSDFALRSAK
ncbi:MAG: hypothetical protein A2Z25_12050 [Planctomycetes bacterium RBG_16_55_9]|nr:MAG: hypothetical protein A2Z25_12050 [Planctomycetes bacterium RBG_16_55_9]